MSAPGPRPRLRYVPAFLGTVAILGSMVLVGGDRAAAVAASLLLLLALTYAWVDR